jgi:putative glycerol-1-phosphate prenyltransferase
VFDLLELSIFAIPIHMNILEYIDTARKAHKKQLALLIDPDKIDEAQVLALVAKAKACSVDLFFVGSSLLLSDRFEQCIALIKSNSSIPVVIFPGSNLQVSAKADAILFLSLISGRNPDMLIGKHVIAAPHLKRSGLEVIPTGYMLIESGTPTAVSYMSNTTPIPHDKNDIAICTAMAGEMLGQRLIYMDAGSGAQNPISVHMIRSVRNSIGVPLIIGGGVRDAEKAAELCQAGADILVVGNVLEKDPSLLQSIADAVHSIK